MSWLWSFVPINCPGYRVLCLLYAIHTKWCVYAFEMSWRWKCCVCNRSMQCCAYVMSFIKLSVYEFSVYEMLCLWSIVPRNVMTVKFCAYKISFIYNVVSMSMRCRSMKYCVYEMCLCQSMKCRFTYAILCQ